MMKKHLLIIVCCLIVLPRLQAQTAQNISLIGLWNEETCYSVFVHGSYAYVGNDNAFHVLDVSDPGAPSKIATLSRSWEIEEIIVINDYAYIAAGDSGFRIIDISNPALPNEISHFRLFEYTQGIDVAGSYAYVASGYSGLHILNISTPTAPAEVASSYMQGEAKNVHVVNNRAYVALSFSGLSILDVTNPIDPQVLGAFYNGMNSQDLFVYNSDVWVAADLNGLRVVNVSVPATPVLVDSFVSANNARSLKIYDDLAYVADGENGFRVLNVNEPGPISQLAFYETAGFAKDVTVANHFIYVADSGRGLFILRLQARVQFSKTQINFATVQLSDSKIDTMSLTNNSEVDLIVDSTRIIGTNADEFSIVSGGNSSVTPAQESRELLINFAPQETGNRAAALIIHSNAVTSPDTLPLRGIGALPPEAKILFSKTNVNFDSVGIGSAERDTLRVTNDSFIDLHIDSTVISGTNAQEFTILNDGGSSVVAPQQSRDLLLTFTPQNSGNRTAALVFHSNAESSPDTLSLSGFGVDLTFTVETDTSAAAGDSLAVSIIPPASYNVLVARIYFRQSKQGEYEFADLALDGGSYKGSVPPEFLSIRGVEYYIYLSDGVTEITYPADDPQNRPVQVPVEIAQFRPAISIERSTYKMISVPLILKNPEIISVLRDDYGVYDPIQWRILRWQPGASRYLEFLETEYAFTPGTAFWLINRSPITFDVEAGSSVNSTAPYVMTLFSGWNQIGNPFAFPIAWGSIQLPANVDPPVYFDGKEYLYDINIFQPWEGYFIYNGNPDPVNLTIPPVEAVEAVSKSKTDFDPESEFRLQILGRVKDSGLTDTQNFIGFKTAATSKKDFDDFYEAPPIGHYLQIASVEGENLYASNYKSDNNGGEHWDLDITLSDKLSKPIDIGLIEHGILNDAYQVYLLDKDFRCSIPVENNSFQLLLTKERPLRRIRVIIGTKDFAEKHSDDISLIPLEYQLFQNYPNPFNPETSIRFQLAKRDHTSLKIYNLLGQEVAALIDEPVETGSHVLKWTGVNKYGRPAPSGVYIFVLKSGRFNAAKKLLLIR